MPSPIRTVAKPQAAVVTQQERDQVLNMPLVREIMEMFDARLIDIRPAQRPKPAAAEEPKEEPKEEE